MTALVAKVQRKKTTMYVYVENNTYVWELKTLISTMIKVLPENQQLFFKDEIMENDKTMAQLGCGLRHFADVEDIPNIGLAVRMENGEFEQLNMIPYSLPSRFSAEQFLCQ